MPQQGSDQKTADQLRQEIAALVEQYHQVAFPTKPFLGGISTLPVSGKFFNADEMQHLVDSSLDFWLTTGRYAEQFETQFAKVMGMKHALLCNSGSSANLLAVTALTSPRLKKRALKEGDEVTAVVVNIDRKTRNIQLSIKAKDAADQADAMQNLSQQSTRENAGTTSLGALLRAKLDNN